MKPRLRQRTMRAALACASVALVGGIFFLAAGDNVWAQAAVAVVTALAVAVIYLEMRHARLRSVRGAGINVLEVAPLITPKMLRSLPPGDRSLMAYVAEQPSSAFATGYRRLAKDLVAAAEGDGRIVAVSSVTGGDGATTTCLCLAQTLALKGIRTLVIDCDLRRKQLSRALGLRQGLGVLDVVAERENWQAVVVSNQGEGFDVLPVGGGVGSVADLYSHRNFASKLEELRPAYDFLILDCPPILGPVDGRMIARAADGCVLVVRWARTPLGAIEMAHSALKRIGASHIAGLFVTQGPRELPAQ